MQDNYVGDIGDYGKYGLLRTVSSQGISLAVNWYKVAPKRIGKQEDGKYIHYLSRPECYRLYDPMLFDSLRNIVCVEKTRTVQRIEKEDLFRARFYSDEIADGRLQWHRRALLQTEGRSTVFLDPDNGLETFRMFRKGGATEKHVKWGELKDYYARGQNVILYQHRPQMTKKEACIDGIMQFQETYLNADCVKLLEFPKYTNRFYFFFLHKEFQTAFEQVFTKMLQHWGREDFCREIQVYQR